MRFITSEMLEVMRISCKDQREYTSVVQAMGLLDAFMVICGLMFSDLKDEKVIGRFWGFLLCETNCSETYAWRHVSAVRKFAYVIGINVDRFKSICGYRTKINCLSLYRESFKSKSMIRYYAGWWIVTYDKSQEIFVNMVLIHDYFGAGYCDYLFLKIKKHIEKYKPESRLGKRRSVNDFLRIVTDNFLSLDELHILQEHDVLNDFLERAYKVELDRAREKRHCELAFNRTWTAMMLVVNEIFVEEGVFPSQSYHPAFEGYKDLVDGNLEQKETKEILGLITKIPSYIPDQEAAEKLYNSINDDLKGVIEACERAREKILHDYRLRKNAARVVPGHAEYSLASEEERQYMDLCRLWAENPYATTDDYEFFKLYGVQKSVAYDQLALLDSSTLLPFVYLIINQVPAITKSWLLNHALSDKNGKNFGFSAEMGTAEGKKPRRGPADEQQIITLTSKAIQYMEEIYELTNEARQYLVSVGDPACKYTLLTTPTGVTRPTNLKRISGMGSEKNYKSLLAKEILKQFGSRGKEVLKRVTLSSMRKTSGVIVYFETSSVQAMSEALGHKNYDPSLLDKYLPKSIRSFYLGRWVRLFQSGLIFESLKNSEYLLDAMAIDTIEELADFIEHHQLKPLPPQMNLKNWMPVDERLQADVSLTGIIPVSQELCTLLIAFDAAVRDVSIEFKNIPKKFSSWFQAATYVSHAVELYNSGELEVVSRDIAEIFSRAKVNTRLVAKISRMLAAELAA
ncbi:hypothetical protein BVH01_09075 [Pseudomonas sp. PA1(2017)]|uniref:hypothetical protein n=1 Tax=Pseudomonas sp. PA1(2017) TaxID=1932113 RepID=UPI0009611F6B|nr:hypothetical protein [Pseudomonas sp. PA1(2017)]OLU16720.1 hypothetical protein BVH01_09075 [Pseudomonas sp. PA1(2017)]